MPSTSFADGVLQMVYSQIPDTKVYKHTVYIYRMAPKK